MRRSPVIVSNARTAISAAASFETANRRRSGTAGAAAAPIAASAPTTGRASGRTPRCIASASRAARSGTASAACGPSADSRRTATRVGHLCRCGPSRQDPGWPASTCRAARTRPVGSGDADATMASASPSREGGSSSPSRRNNSGTARVSPTQPRATATSADTAGSTSIRVSCSATRRVAVSEAHTTPTAAIRTAEARSGNTADSTGASRTGAARHARIASAAIARPA